MIKTSELTKSLTQSGIRSASSECARIGGINLGQGICNLPVEDSLKEAAHQAMLENKTIYSACEGILALREAIAKKCHSYNHIDVDPNTEVMVSHGSTGSFVSCAMSIFNPGDEVILFEPFYGYHRNILKLYQVEVKAVQINMADFSINIEDIEKQINPKTKAIIICTPCNPCGKVFSKQELIAIGELAEKHNLAIITDEIYEYITYPGYEHISIASLKNFKERTITISGFSKTYNMTGWRLGYATGPKNVIQKMALVQDLVYVCPSTPLQHAVISAFDIKDDYYENMRQGYLEKRSIVTDTLTEMNLKFATPQGAYYIIVDFSHLGFEDDVAIAKRFLQDAKVAVVPGNSFYLDANRGKGKIRLCYALDKPTVQEAMLAMKNAVWW